ncbi:NfeD family protein [Aerosakkonemataceae cyanobacterium BLCC-F154]|uniref:NfeD family protein n=1 Tax=Floridaenema fluviatile BLCC-F154 TaxID=3153640 RepID=A0ABV4YH09_9CYAN
MYFIFIQFIAQTTANSSFSFSPPWLWFTVGVVLCSTEFFLAKKLPKKFQNIALLLGISAFVTSISVWQMAVFMEVDWSLTNNYDEDFPIQIVYWMGISLASVIWVRPGLSKSKKTVIPDAKEAKTITEVLPGKPGKVLYEGSYWKAFCVDKQMAIAPNQKVSVLRREANTLIISPRQ